MSGPSKTAETIVGLFVPPACREEVLGDLHERYQSPLQYAADVCNTLPLVVMSRIRRTADPRMLLIQACVWYASFLGAALGVTRLENGLVLNQRWALLRLALPVAMALLGLILDDAYSRPGQATALSRSRGPLAGAALVFLSQFTLRVGSSDWAIPGLVLLYGCAMSLLLSSAIRILLSPPGAGQLLGANAAAAKLERAARPSPRSLDSHRVRAIYLVAGTVLVVGWWMIVRGEPAKLAMMPSLLILLVVYQMWKRN